MSRLSLPRLLVLALSAACLCACEDAAPKKEDAAGKDAATADTAAGEDSAADTAGTDAEEDTVAVEEVADAEPEVEEDTGPEPFDVVAPPPPDGCTPDCKGKVCGPNGCGSVCGFCKSGQFCATDGSKCQAFCEKKCQGKACGDDGCGGKCGTCEDKFSCGIDFLCHPDDCQGSCDGKECGDDGCGKSCGVCATGDYCDPTSKCKPTPCKGIPEKGDCQGDVLIWCDGSGATGVKKTKDCGAGGANLTCGWDAGANKNGCVPPTCDDSCKTADGKNIVCGPNQCGKECGKCPDGWKCNVTACIAQTGGACSSSTFPVAGQCDGDVWIYCNTGKIVAKDCVKEYGAKGCGWDAAAGKFGCVF